MTQRTIFLAAILLFGCGPVMTDLAVPIGFASAQFAGTGRNDIWAAAQGQPSILHYDGSTWSTVPTEPSLLENIDWMRSLGWVSSAGEGAIWIAGGRSSIRIPQPFLYKLRVDGSLEDHTSELPAPEFAAWTIQLASGEGTAWLAFTEPVMGQGEFTRVFRSNGGRFEEVGNLPSNLVFSKVLGPDFAMLRPGSNEGAYKRFDGTTWMDDTGLPPNFLIYGVKRAWGVHAAMFWRSNSPGGVYVFENGTWTPKPIQLPAWVTNGGKVLHGYQPFGLASTGPGKFSLLSIKADVDEPSNAFAAPVSGSTKGGDILLYNQEAYCSNASACLSQVDPYSGVMQLDDGTVLIRNRGTTYIGSSSDMD